MTRTMPPMVGLLAGCLVGGLGTGVLAGLVAQLTGSSLVLRLVSVALLSWAVVAMHLGWGGPERRVQVPVLWRDYMHPFRLSFLWGTLLGSGWSTRLVVPPAMYGLLAVSFLQLRLDHAMFLWVLYACARGTTIAMASLAASLAAGKANRPEAYLVGLRAAARVPLTVLLTVALAVAVVR